MLKYVTFILRLSSAGLWQKSLTPSGSLCPSDRTTDSSSDGKQTAWRMFINDRERPATRSFPLFSISARLSALYQVCITGWHQMLSTHPVPLTAIAKYGCGPARCGRVGGRRPAPLHALKDIPSENVSPQLSVWSFTDKGKYPYKEHFHYMYNSTWLMITNS